MKEKTLYVTRGAAVAALYVLLTFISSLFGLDKGVIQFRLSEMLCILPIFLPEAVPGLFIGCIVANLMTSAVIWDVIFGSTATLIGAIGARLFRKLPKKLIWLATLPTILSNSIIVPLVLKFAYGVTDLIPFMVLTVGIGEIVTAGILGMLLYFSLVKNKFLNNL